MGGAKENVLIKDSVKQVMEISGSVQALSLEEFYIWLDSKTDIVYAQHQTISFLFDTHVKRLNHNTHTHSHTQFSLH